jgi:hypothetical protein
VQVRQERVQQAVQCGKAEAQLRLDARQPGHLHVPSLLDGVLQQGRPADPGLSPQHERIAGTGSCAGEYPVERCALLVPIEQYRRRGGGGSGRMGS